MEVNTGVTALPMSVADMVLIALVLLNLIVGIVILAKVLSRRGQSQAPSQLQSAYAPTQARGADGALIAVITAAVAVAMGSQPAAQGGQGGFVVTSIRRVQNAPAWNRAGREEQIYSRR